MNEDELALLVRSYADEAARAHLGAVTVRLSAGTGEDGIAWADVTFVPAGAEATAARDACVRLLDADSNVYCDTVFEAEADGAPSLSVLGANVDDLPPEGDDELPPAEEDELAGQLDMPEGPLAVTVEGIPAPLPGIETRFVVVGLSLSGRGWTGKVYKSGKVADPERATYWALKHERAYKEQGFRAATSVVYQVEVGEEELLDRVLAAMNRAGA
jgi:hypothetical protein